MAKYAVLQSFYASETWIRFRQGLIVDRMQDGKIVCDYCHHPITDFSKIIAHHTTELTPENYKDVSISLNPSKIQLVHHECHNRIHDRFGNRLERCVYLVYGPPLSGKTTFVKEHMKSGDIVVDMDKLYAAVSLLPEYEKPNNLFNNVIGIHNLLLDNIKTRYGKWNNAWIVGGYADKYKRERIAEDLGAEIIYCDVSKEECLRRLEEDSARKYRIKEWIEYVNKWFEAYQ